MKSFVEAKNYLLLNSSCLCPHVLVKKPIYLVLINICIPKTAGNWCLRPSAQIYQSACGALQVHHLPHSPVCKTFEVKVMNVGQIRVNEEIVKNSLALHNWLLIHI